MKSLIASILILGLVGLVVGVVVKAQTTAGVSATVEPKLVAVSVSDGAVDYGILDFSTTEDTIALTDTQVITNESNVSAKFDVKSSDAVGGTVNWDLVAFTAIAKDAYGHQYVIDAGATPSWTDFPTDNSYATNVVTLDEKGGTDDTANLDLKLYMPTDSTDATGAKTITVTVLVHE